MSLSHLDFVISSHKYVHLCTCVIKESEGRLLELQNKPLESEIQKTHV